MPSLAIVPAAGKAERFGGGKLIAPIGGEPLLNHTLRALLDGGVETVVLVIAPDSDLPGVTLLEDPRVQRVLNPDPARGMFSSIQAGLQADDGDPILILPGDMPFVRSSTVAVLLEAARESEQIVSPLMQGRRGHPVAIPSRLRHEILAAPAGATLARILEAHERERRDLDIGDPGVLRDVDMRSDLPQT